MTNFLNDAVQRGWLPGGPNSDLRWSTHRPTMSKQRKLKVGTSPSSY